MSFKSFLNPIQHILAKSKVVVSVAIKLRNQCNCIIAYYLAETSDHHDNGELWLIKMLAPNCSKFIDVGGYVGEWTECFLAYTHKDSLGLVFEPGESSFRQIENKFKDNSRLSLVQSACSDSIGEEIFYDIYPNQTSSLGKQKNNSGIAKLVKVTTLDKEIKSRDWDYIDFLKIDCEGYDLHVLRGGVEMLSQQRIGVIQFEYGESWANAGSTLFSCLRMLESFDYKIFLLAKDGLLEFEYEIYGDYFRYSNFVAISQDKVDKYSYLIKGVA